MKRIKTESNRLIFIGIMATLKELLNYTQKTELHQHILEMFKLGCAADFFAISDAECMGENSCAACWNKELRHNGEG